LRKLPFDKASRIDEITKRVTTSLATESRYYSDVVDLTVFNSEIELLANERRVYFIVDSPTFVLTYIEDGVVKTKNYSVQSFKFDTAFFDIIRQEYQNGKLFVFYTLSKYLNSPINQSYSIIIRGLFIESGDLISEDRDNRITEILN